MKDQSTLKLSAAIVLVTFSCVMFSMLSACGHKGAGSDNQDQGSGKPARIVTPGIMKAQQIARNAQVVCGKSQQCPESVGMVVSTNEGGVDSCTGFLLDNDLVMTSLKCIPQDLRAEDSACSSRIQVLFPANGKLAAQSADCWQVIVHPGEAQAYLRLASPVLRRPLDINADGFSDGSTVSVAVVNPTSKTMPYGEVSEKRCEVVQGSAVLPSFRSDYSPVVSLAHCQIGSANLGAPVIDSSGTVRGIIRSGFDGMAQFRSANSKLLERSEMTDFDFAFVTNLACAQTPLEKGTHNLPLACVASAALPELLGTARLVTPELLQSVQSALQKSLNTWKEPFAAHVHWVIPTLPSDSQLRVQPTPECFANTGAWLTGYRSFLGRIFGSGYSSDATEDLLFPIYSVTYNLNALGQTVPRFSPPEMIRAMLKFSPRQLAEKGNSTFSIQFRDKPGFLFPLASLKNCAIAAP